MITIVDYLLLPEIDPKPLQRPYIGPEYVGVRSSGAFSKVEISVYKVSRLNIHSVLEWI